MQNEDFVTVNGEVRPMPTLETRGSRWPRMSLMFALATGLCLSVVFVTSPQDPMSGVFGFMGYLGMLVFVATGACIWIDRSGRARKVLVTFGVLWGVAVLFYIASVIPVIGSPTTGDPDFDMNAWYLVLFRFAFSLLRWLGIACGVCACIAASSGWASYLTGRQKKSAETDRQAYIKYWLACAAAIAYFAVGCFEFAPDYSTPTLLNFLAFGAIAGCSVAAYARRSSSDQPEISAA
ncbi:MAG: hypothetical protein AAF394_19360 [Planctomycetota bacterium]